MNPMFDFNGDGKMDALEFMLAAGLLEDAPDSPFKEDMPGGGRCTVSGLFDEDDEDGDAFTDDECGWDE